MKVKIKKTGEIVNVRKNETIELEWYDDSCQHAELLLEDVEFIPENTISYPEIERRKRITELAKQMYISPVYANSNFEKCLIEAEKIIEQEENYINRI